jgi:MarR family transcriptional regulator, organic hydroperoxide resistance regulator
MTRTPSQQIDPASQHLTLDQQICFPLYAASNLIVRAYGPLLKPLGLTYPQYLVMMALWEKQELSVGELGQHLHLDSGTLTPLLKRMESNGHVLRQRSREDERRVQICLTDTGKALQTPAAAIPKVLACRLGNNLPWLQQLQSDLHKLINLLG